LRRRLPLSIVAGIALTVVAIAYSYDSSLSRRERDAKRVYFVLSFANGNRVPADTSEIEESWRHCKETLSDIFGRVSSAKIEVSPTAPNPEYKKYLWEELKSGRNFKQVLWDRGRPPDLLLTATISMYPHESSKVFKSQPELDWLEERQLVSTGAQWQYNNLIPLEDKPFVSLAIAAWVWRWIESQPEAPVKPSDSTVVNKRILELYAQFLSAREVVDDNLLTQVQSALPTDDEVACLLNAYHEKLKQSTAQNAIAKGEEENRKRLLKVSQLAKKDQ